MAGGFDLLAGCPAIAERDGAAPLRSDDPVWRGGRHLFGWKPMLGTTVDRLGQIAAMDRAPRSR
jgi:hypothetical protein